MQIEAETHFHINSRARISYHYQCEDSILQNDHIPVGPLHNIDSWTFEHISFLGPFFSPHHANGGVQ
jgi:hypothetical protein